MHIFALLKYLINQTYINDKYRIITFSQHQ